MELHIDRTLGPTVGVSQVVGTEPIISQTNLVGCSRLFKK